MSRKAWTIEAPVDKQYNIKEKYDDTSVCENCNVVFTKGLYKWKKVIPENAIKIVCPACLRIKENFEGGYLLLEGIFFAEHKKEMINLVKKIEQIETEKNPLERIMEINDKGNRLSIRTTYGNLAKTIGNSIQRTYKGELKFNYQDEDKYIILYWKRDF